MASRTPKPIAERFWGKVKQAGDCWEWTANVGGGYGRINRSRPESRTGGGPRGIQAHRWAYEALVSEIPPGLQLDHLCRNQLCVNPYHLDPVPQVVNLMRGAGLSAINAAKTHCKNGHEFTPENTYTRSKPNGRQLRSCKTCVRAESNARYHRTKKTSKKEA